MQNKKVCEIEDCKANLPHRLGIHSNWCPHFSLTDVAARQKMSQIGDIYSRERTKVDWLSE